MGIDFEGLGRGLCDCIDQVRGAVVERWSIPLQAGIQLGSLGGLASQTHRSSILGNYPARMVEHCPPRELTSIRIEGRVVLGPMSFV